jgi:hypothetical protein
MDDEAASPDPLSALLGASVQILGQRQASRKDRDEMDHQADPAAWLVVACSMDGPVRSPFSSLVRLAIMAEAALSGGGGSFQCWVMGRCMIEPFGVALSAMFCTMWWLSSCEFQGCFCVKRRLRMIRQAAHLYSPNP